MKRTENDKLACKKLKLKYVLKYLWENNTKIYNVYWCNHNNIITIQES